MAFTSLFVAATCAAFATAAPVCSDMKGTWFTGTWTSVSLGAPTPISGQTIVRMTGQLSGQCTCQENGNGISGYCWPNTGGAYLYTGRNSGLLVFHEGELNGVWEKGCSNLAGTWTGSNNAPNLEFSGCDADAQDGTRYCTQSKYGSKSGTCSCDPNQSPPSGTCWYGVETFTYKQGDSEVLYTDNWVKSWVKSGPAAYQLEEQGDESNAANSTVTIAAIIAGSGLCLVIMVVVAVLFYLKRRKQKQMHFVEDNEKENESADENADEIAVEVDAETTTGLEKKLNELE